MPPRDRRGLMLRAPAKLNLRLEVDPLGPDGFHPLRTLLVALDGLHDVVHVTPATRRSVLCPGVPERDNLAWRALEAIEAATGRRLPVAVRIDKRIPSRAGLGGGSSDAAAVMRAVDRLFALEIGPEHLEELAAEVGSDVPFFIRGGAQWATGRGERLCPARVEPFAAALVMPVAQGLPTAEVYRRFDAIAPGPAPGGEVVVGDAAPGFPALASWVRNDLWPAALSLEPRLGAAARALRVAGARRVLLCGSGACLAGLAAGPQEARRIARSVEGVIAVVGGVVTPARAAG